MQRVSTSCAWLIGPVAFALACSGEASAPLLSSGSRLYVDRVASVTGVPDHGADPAIVGIMADGQSPCAGALIAPDIVLTARHCVSVARGPIHCPSSQRPALGLRDATSLRIFSGDDIATAEERASGRKILVPPGDELCVTDLALVLLDVPIDDLEPLAVRATGAARGDHVRTVGFGLRPASGSAGKVLRDHVRVIDTTDTGLRVAEGACRGCGGDPALDETTGAVLGVVSRAVDDASNVYTRADALIPFIAKALEESAARVGVHRAAVRKKRAKKGPFDVGADCASGADCAAGTCVSDGARQYCSRPCGADDKCPPRFRCQRGEEERGAHREIWACAER